MTALLNALERAQRPGWGGVVVTAIASAVAIALIVVAQQVLQVKRFAEQQFAPPLPVAVSPPWPIEAPDPDQDDRHPRPRDEPSDGFDTTAPPAIRTALQEALSSHVKEIGRCYEQQLPRHPMLSGRLEFAIRVAPDGRVAEVTPGGVTLTGKDSDASELTGCVVARIRTWRLPPARDGYEVAYPIAFQTD